MTNIKKNKIITIILVIIIIALATLCALFATDTISLKDKCVNNKQNSSTAISTEADNQNTEENNIVSNSDSSDNKVNDTDEVDTTEKKESRLVDKVFISQDNNSYYLILWDDGTYRYDGSDSTNKTYGKYYLDDEKLVLYYMFAIDADNKNKVTVANGSKTLKVISQSQLADGNITFISANQAAREGGRNFYTDIYGLLEYYHNEQMEELGIN